MSAAEDNRAPLSPAEADALLAPLLAYGTVVLAVSGGADSTASMLLAASWAARTPTGPRLVVVSIDHGLRPEAAAESDAVATQARALGLEARVLRWEGPRPATGIQTAARDARYGLLMQIALEAAGAAAGPRPAAIATAHTADDQAETLLMRLARGSGVDGLAGIPARGRLEQTGADGRIESVDILRPLLSVPRARLIATLEAAGITWLDDPSNRDGRFERVRVRQALRLLEPLGVGREALARTATRMQAARAALDHAVDQLWAATVACPFDATFVEIDRRAVADAPDEVGVRLLRRVLARAGGAGGPAELSAVESACRRLFGNADAAVVPAFTLGGCIVAVEARDARAASLVRVWREPDRAAGLPRIGLAPGQDVLWDRRYRASVSVRHPGPVEIGPVGDDWHALAAASPVLRRLGIPAGAIRGLPAFRVRGIIAAVPTLSMAAAEIGDAAAAARLAGPLEPAVEGGQMLPQLRAHRWLASLPDAD